MTDKSKNVIPIFFQVGGKVVFSGELDLAALVSAVAAVSSSPSNYKSYPITEDQAQQLLRKIDAKTVDFLRALAQSGGELNFARMQQIFDIEKWADFSARFGKGLTRALRHLTNNSSASLVWWADDEWGSDNDPEGCVYIDGPALKSLQAAFGISST